MATGAWTPAPRGWYLALAAGSLPAFVLGMVASALADRLAFAGWALVAGFGHALLLRAAWQRGWSVAGRAALVLAWGSLCLLAFATLVIRHGEILDLGYRAVLWPIYAPLLTRPSSWRLLASLLALAAALAWWRAAAGRRAPPPPATGVAPGECRSTASRTPARATRGTPATSASSPTARRSTR
jgi:hypothetical protein